MGSTEMKITNYTSGVDVGRTVARIEQLLADFGATAIAKNYEAGKISSLTFQIPINGRDTLIRLPAKPDAIFKVLSKEVKKPHSGTMDRLREQSERTAWKIQQDWLEIELTNIQLNQKEQLEVFLAYVWNGEQTYYTALKESKFKALLTDKT
jgi:hypothetical protein